MKLNPQMLRAHNQLCFDVQQSILIKARARFPDLCLYYLSSDAADM